MRSYLTTFGSLAAVGVMLAAFSSCGSDSPKTQGSSTGATDPDLAAAKAQLASMPLGHVVSRDVRGIGRFVMATPQTNATPLNLGHETIARLHFERHAATLGLNDAAVHGATFKSWHTMPTGAGVAQFEQRIDDIEVFRARASVVVDSGNHLVSIASTFPGNVKAWNRASNFKLAAEDALAAAYTANAGVPLRGSAVRDQGAIDGSSARNYAVDAPFGALRVLSATAKRVFFPTGDRLEPAFYVEILGRAAGSNVNDARSYVIAASDGSVLQQESLTMNDAFSYKVWADPGGNHIPADGPIADVTPHPTGMPDHKAQVFTAPVAISMEGFNKNPSGVADPWLDANATTTWGNNVQAYSDRNQGTGGDGGTNVNDGYQDSGTDASKADITADITSAKTFDRTYDLTKKPDFNDDQIKAAVTQIFYTTNWLHDYWYDSGFDEKSGNAQLSNFGRGGAQGDPMHAEAQDSADSGQSNNANMNPLSDGSSPRMQMYVWTGLPNRTLTVPGVTIADALGGSGFGPQVFDLTGTAVLSDDGSTAIPPAPDGSGTTPGTTSDGCQVPTNVMGKIAVIDRGTCTFTFKVGNAKAGGAIGIILINNAAGHAAVSPGGAYTTDLPLIGVSLEDGMNIKGVLGTTPMVTLHRGEETMRDGTIDNTVVAHEWGHYWHHRLVQCGQASCNGMSEGWGDFDALMMVLKDTDRFDASQTYALAQYAAQGIANDGSYFGIRRAPYSRDMAKNPFTFQHVRQMATLPTGAPLAPAGTDMSEVHNVGEIWAEALFEGYTNLLDLLRTATPTVSFDEAKRRMADYLVAGMKATPNEPTFVEQRDAILSAVLATNRMDDFSAIAKGFAKRGLGVAAVAPPITSTTLNEAVENMDFKGALSFVDVKLDDSGTSCDRDGVLDANESGKLTVTVKNGGWLKLAKTQIKATSTDANLTFDTSTDMASIDPYKQATVTLNVTAKAGLAKKGLIPITITMMDADAVKPSVDVPVSVLLNYDDAKATSKTDDVESELPPVWTMAHKTATGSDAGAPATTTSAWSRKADAMNNHVWHGDDLPTSADESLVSPDLTVSATESFTIGFSHHYAFETGTSPTGSGMANFDGAVLEISENGGGWSDVSMYGVDPGYGASPIFTSNGDPSLPDTNALAGRKAWVGKSAANVDTKLDFGTKLAGKTIKVRFRIGTDEGTGAAGWDIDNIAFGGITNSPFSKINDNAATGTCTAGDGGTTTDAGAKDGGGGAAGATGGTTGTGGTGTTDTASCNCSVPGGRSTGSLAAFGSLAALATALIRRRRRQQG